MKKSFDIWLLTTAVSLLAGSHHFVVTVSPFTGSRARRKVLMVVAAFDNTFPFMYYFQWLV